MCQTRVAAVVVAVLLALSAAQAQTPCPDHLEYFKELLSDEGRGAAELQRRENDCLNALLLLPKDQLSEVLAMAERAMESKDQQVRIYATGLAGFVSMFRPDSASLIVKLLPELEKRYTDPIGKVRSNAVSTVINIKPRPPVEAAEALAGCLEDARNRDNTFAGLVRIAPMPEWLAGRLVAEIDRTEDPTAHGNLMRILGHATGEVREEIIASLATGLRSPERAVVDGAIGAIAQLGPRAASTSSELRRLASQTKDESLSKSALLLAERLESPKR